MIRSLSRWVRYWSIKTISVFAAFAVLCGVANEQPVTGFNYQTGNARQ